MIFMRVWENIKKKVESVSDEKKVRSISVWHFLLMAFIVVWMVGAYIYLDQKSDANVAAPPVVVLDTADGINLTNLFQSSPTNMQLVKRTSDPSKPSKAMFELKPKYSLGDVVVVKYFYVEAIVVGTPAMGDEYIILYKDHNHTLQKISLPRMFLMAPAEGVLNPVSMLVD